MQDLHVKIGNFVAIVYLLITQNKATKFSNADIHDLLSYYKIDNNIKHIVGDKPYNKIANACKSNINQIIPFDGNINEVPDECVELLKNSKLEYIDNNFYLLLDNIHDKDFFLKWKSLSWINKNLYENNEKQHGILKSVIEKALKDDFLMECESYNKSFMRKNNKALDDPNVATKQYYYRDKHNILHTTYCNKKNISFYDIFSKNEQKYLSPEIIINNIKNKFHTVKIVSVLKENNYDFSFLLFEQKISNEFTCNTNYNIENNGQFFMF
jgi:hypothetical protein